MVKLILQTNRKTKYIIIILLLHHDFTLLVQAHPGSSGHWAVKWVLLLLHYG